jgi:hypothetical protein
MKQYASGTEFLEFVANSYEYEAWFDQISDQNNEIRSFDSVMKFLEWEEMNERRRDELHTNPWRIDDKGYPTVFQAVKKGGCMLTSNIGHRAEMVQLVFKDFVTLVSGGQLAWPTTDNGEHSQHPAHVHIKLSLGRDDLTITTDDIKAINSLIHEMSAEAGRRGLCPWEPKGFVYDSSAARIVSWEQVCVISRALCHELPGPTDLGRAYIALAPERRTALLHGQNVLEDSKGPDMIRGKFVWRRFEADDVDFIQWISASTGGILSADKLDNGEWRIIYTPPKKVPCYQGMYHRLVSRQ